MNKETSNGVQQLAAFCRLPDVNKGQVTIRALVDGVDAHDRAYLEHLIFGIALALIYESRPSSNGIRFDEE